MSVMEIQFKKLYSEKTNDIQSISVIKTNNHFYSFRKFDVLATICHQGHFFVFSLTFGLDEKKNLFNNHDFEFKFDDFLFNFHDFEFKFVNFLINIR